VGAMNNAHAVEADSLSVDATQQVIYCTALWAGGQKALSDALQAGIAVTVVWNVQVEEVHSYWLNSPVAEIQLRRRVVPDLLSRNWLLEDVASGISRRVYSLPEAVRFLSSLESFPVLDRTLLVADAVYRMSITIEQHDGDMSDAWWARFWRHEHFNMQQDFSLL